MGLGASVQNMSEFDSELCPECGGLATTNRMDWASLLTAPCSALLFESAYDLIDQLIHHLVTSPRVPRDPAEFFAAKSLASWVDGEPIADSIRRHPSLASDALDQMCYHLVSQAIPWKRPWSRDPIPPNAVVVYQAYPMLSLGTGRLSQAWIYRSLARAYTIVEQAERDLLNEVWWVRFRALKRDGALAPDLTQELADCTTEVAYKFASNGAYGAEWTMGRQPEVLFANEVPRGVGFPGWPHTFAWANL